MLILASNSPRRRELLLSLGIPFAVEAADIEEIESLDDPREVPLRNAERKAAAVAARHPHDPVLGADTVIVFRDAVIGKPRDEADALRILLSLAGKTHEVVTGLALLRGADGFRRIWRERLASPSSRSAGRRRSVICRLSPCSTRPEPTRFRNPASLW